MRKCELCDAEATVGIVEVGFGDEGDGSVQRHLCEKCAKRVYGESPRDSETATRHENETPEEIVAFAKQMRELMRNQINRKLASHLYDLYKRLVAIAIEQFGRPLMPEPQNREEWIDANVRRREQYWDRFVAFVEKHKRWPNDDERNYLHLLGE